MGRHIKTIEERFWPKVDQRGSNECWLWTGSKAGGKVKYGILQFNGVTTGAHRVSWMLHNGPIPEGLDVCHTCDNGLCCNPKHLWLGTHTDNMRDKNRKGRGNFAFGERAHAAKLTEQDVLQIREWLKQGISQREIARRKGVTSVSICHINTGETWSHV